MLTAHVAEVRADLRVCLLGQDLSNERQERPRRDLFAQCLEGKGGRIGRCQGRTFSVFHASLLDTETAPPAEAQIFDQVAPEPTAHCYGQAEFAAAVS